MMVDEASGNATDDGFSQATEIQHKKRSGIDGREALFGLRCVSVGGLSCCEYGQIGELQTLQGAVEDGSSSNAISIAVAEDRRGSSGV